jgi:thiol-disulfide isomerase/thioredoxin
MPRLAVLTTLAVAVLTAAALSGDIVPPTASPKTASTEPIAIGGQLPADLSVAALPHVETDVPLASLGGDATKPLVVLFWSAKCPVCRRYAAAVKALAKDYDGRARLVLVFPNATETDADVRAWLDAEGVTSVAALDKRREAASKLAAVVTPSALVFDATGVLRYRGPIDDDRRARRKETNDLLRVALESVLAGKPAENPEPRAFGSSVRAARR